jgi:peptidoglycan-associated lipoprotein
MPYGTKPSSLWAIAVTFAALSVIFAAGCGKKPTPTTDVAKAPTTQTQTPTEQPKEPAKPAVEPQIEMVLQDVYFDYDKSNLREDARLTLEQDAQLLSKNTGVRVLLEGHCDERGTVEYNLALGDKRAQSVRAYLVQFGIDAGRLSTISYGEERPFAQGSDDSAWSQNRRVHFVTQK